ncbi:hypothetical protein F2P81_009588 [Scophthalmus maximus]|uniref:Uncharacterized protein n=1 Tax=Scophthalmus maximus TaxID=52904 RepID=A0A6A4T7C1_SCOMX|nr:hypothetical protein F2P81_009588 [Scophthalmus maximus]
MAASHKVIYCKISISMLDYCEMKSSTLTTSGDVLQKCQTGLLFSERGVVRSSLRGTAADWRLLEVRLSLLVQAIHCGQTFEDDGPALETNNGLLPCFAMRQQFDMTLQLCRY